MKRNFYYLVAFGQHDHGLRVVIPHHLPELHDRIFHRMLADDKLTIAMEAWKRIIVFASRSKVTSSSSDRSIAYQRST